MSRIKAPHLRTASEYSCSFKFEKKNSRAILKRRFQTPQLQSVSSVSAFVFAVICTTNSSLTYSGILSTNNICVSSAYTNNQFALFLQSLQDSSWTSSTIIWTIIRLSALGTGALLNFWTVRVGAYSRMGVYDVFIIFWWNSITLQ